MALEQINQRISRGNPYFWVTWLTKLLVGESSCEWASWLKGNYKNYEKVPSTFDLASWQMNHAALLNQVKDQLESAGETVFTEKQNSFTLRGGKATLGGKPDLISISDRKRTIHDVKTGKPSPAHSAQVMLYMYAIPRALRQHNGMVFDGRVIYPDHSIDIPNSAVDGEFVQRLGQLIQRLSSPQAAPKIPSWGECQYCDISQAECPERVYEEQDENGLTDDF